MVFYQAGDGSVRELNGNGPPIASDTYVESALIAPNNVRKNTPMGILRLGPDNDPVRARSFQPFTLFLEHWLIISTRYQRNFNYTSLTLRIGSILLSKEEAPG